MLPDFFQTELLKFPHVEHCFFYRKDQLGNLYDFKAPLDTHLAQKIIDAHKLERLLILNQNHTSNCAVYPSLQTQSYADACVTAKKRVGLLIRHADCQAALFYDPKRHVIACAHAGFRGQILKIYSETLKTMQKDFGCQMEDIYVAISPSLGLENAEFINFETEFPTAFHKYAQDYHMDLKLMAREELLDAGIKLAHLFIDPRCTFGDQNLFYSYRLNKTSSRLGSLIFLK